ncbi:hypothetical protein ACIP4S_32815 [Streptomyces chartreusis]|uniref:hypothetical protein n=1 Tax=Streptomyces chartreusis TaxID=1969 RepID=UPI00381AB0BA
MDGVSAQALALPRSARWREAVETALIGDWNSALWDTGHLPSSALGTLKAEVRALHRQLVPLWRRRTVHGRVLSLDADLGGLSLYDLVATDVDLLGHTTGGVFEDDRLNRVLRGLDPAERAVVFAYAEGEGTTWTEAATAAGATDPTALGERVRRKAKRIAAEQARPHRVDIAVISPRRPGTGGGHRRRSGARSLTLAEGRLVGARGRRALHSKRIRRSARVRAPWPRDAM